MPEFRVCRVDSGPVSVACVAWYVGSSKKYIRNVCVCVYVLHGLIYLLILEGRGVSLRTSSLDSSGWSTSLPLPGTHPLHIHTYIYRDTHTYTQSVWTLLESYIVLTSIQECTNCEAPDIVNRQTLPVHSPIQIHKPTQSYDYHNESVRILACTN